MLNRIFILLCSLGIYQAFASPNYHILIEKMAEDEVAAQIQSPANGKVDIQATPLDDRLSLTQCEAPLDVVIVNGQVRKNTVVKITCDTAPWHTYVQVRVKITTPVVVAKRLLAPGAILSDQNITISFVELYTLRGNVVADPLKLYGVKAKRRIPKGRAIKMRDVCFICKGDNVVIKARVSGLEIKTNGIAINSASLGDTIRVRNAQTNKVVVGKVTGISEMEVKL
ncbi:MULTISPECIES: flagellar basal body P-ring formation chaperone FlgA [unclassified Motilimonas]|uniref:flagellar basal body P-ring formation chaperone FlgA n=1 Tax=unclassified Motilimonas TaxID=2643697 RepID=UPI001E4692A9|nr:MULTISPECIES: flagellar basal body P-ring formation chaperone FlgA [unclassified Motilimonas]MCE0556192.1 flagellar basal body P-ring formation protein FlgA [Motilimonas sp. E26]MDO6524938.1 flagellar basal body P-ring formation chaperone FlgA [Motilimonas sp. 1_MG-2023]